MSLQTDVTLTNNTSSKKFLFRGVALQSKKAQPVIPFSLINSESDSTFLFRFFGQSETVTFSFVITNDGVDVSDGTQSGGVTTISQQLQYLKDTVFTADFQDTWLVEFSELYGVTGLTGVVTNLTFDVPVGSPAIRRGTISLQRGRLAEI